MRRPDPLLVAAVVLQWIVTAGVAVTATHAGSLFGDQAAAERIVGASSSLVHGSLPTVPAPGYALLLAPIVAVTDDVGSVASVVTTLNIVILAPLCAFFLFELAQGAAGRLFAGVTMLVWSLAPAGATHLFEPKYHGTYVDDVLPALYGLTLQPEYVAMTLSIAAAALAMRAIAGRRRCALVAGVLAGAAIGVAPVAAGVALGVLAGIAASGRWRSILDAGIGLLVALLPTVVWRQRVLGGPTFTLGHPSWSTYQSAMAQVREFFWSNRLLEWLPIAGVIGAARLMPALAVLIGGWLIAAAILVAATTADLTGGRMFILLIPAWPAYALAIAAIPALVPTLVRRLGNDLAPRNGCGEVSRRSAAVALALLVALPLALVLAVGH